MRARGSISPSRHCDFELSIPVVKTPVRLCRQLGMDLVRLVVHFEPTVYVSQHFRASSEKGEVGRTLDISLLRFAVEVIVIGL